MNPPQFSYLAVLASGVLLSSLVGCPNDGQGVPNSPNNAGDSTGAVDTRFGDQYVQEEATELLDTTLTRLPDRTDTFASVLDDDELSDDAVLGVRIAAGAH